MTTPRPKTITREMWLEAAKRTVARLIEVDLLDSHQLDDGARDLSQVDCGMYADGCAIARKLDDNFGWDCNMRTAEILDGHSAELRSELGRAEKAWAQATNRQPPLPIGTRVQLSERETGEITGIYEYGPAKYLVKIDGDPQVEAPTCSRRVVNFEDAKAA